MEKKIIVADDQTLTLNFFQDFFSSCYPSYNLEFYKSGEELESRIFKKGFQNVSLIIVDEVMDPGVRGLDFIKKYSSQAGKEGCKLVLHITEGLEEEALKAGAFDYIAKPISFPKLEEIIKNALD